MSNRGKNFSGQKFGMLIVLQDIKPSEKISRPRNRYVLCQCVCGRQTSVRVDHLTRGATQSCGCKAADGAFDKAMDAILAGDLAAADVHAEQEKKLRAGFAAARATGASIEDAAAAVRAAERARIAAQPKLIEAERKHGLPPGAYADMMARQGGVCAICLKRSVKALAIDHCHKTQRVRGLLCMKCNTALGHFGDDPIALARAINYICT